MKTTKFSLVAVAAMALVGCTDDFTAEFQKTEGQEYANGRLVAPGLLTASRGETDGTRAFTYNAKSIWMPTELSNDGTVLNNSNARIGLCWTGMGFERDENNQKLIGEDGKPISFGATDTPTANVYTNYEFAHIGWLGFDETAPEFEDCDEDKLTNGAVLKFNPELTIKPLANFTANNADAAKRVTGYQKQGTKNPYDENIIGKVADKDYLLNLGNGIFKTENKSVYAGDYLVYSPYNPNFTKGPIVAASPREFTVDKGDDNWKQNSLYAFTLGQLEGYEGGTSSTGFTGKVLSSYASIHIAWHDAHAEEMHRIKQIILYSEEGELLYESKISAAKALEELNDNKVSANIFMTGEGDQKKTNSIFVNLTSKQADNSVLNFWELGKKTADVAKPDTIVMVPVLPQTVSNLVVYLVDDAGLSSEYKFTNVEFKSNVANKLTVNLCESDFKPLYLAVDENSLVEAFQLIWDKGAKSDATTPYTEVSTIKVLNDIDIEHDHTDRTQPIPGLFFRNDVKIITTCGAKLILKSTKYNETEVTIQSRDDAAKLECNVDVVIEGKECCGRDAAKLFIGGGENECTVDINGNVENRGYLALGNSTTKKSTIHIDKLWNQSWAVDKNEKLVKPRDYADVNDNEAVVVFCGKKGNKVTIDEMVNYGTVLSAQGKTKLPDAWVNDDPTNATGLISLPKSYVYTGTEKEYAYLAVETTIDKLTNYKDVTVDAMTTVNVGELVNKHDDGKSYTKPFSTAAVTPQPNYTRNANQPTAVIKVEGAGYSETEDAHFELGKSENDGIIDNWGATDFDESLQNSGLFVDRQNGQIGGVVVTNAEGEKGDIIYGDERYYTDLSKGMYVVQVKTEGRLMKALTNNIIYGSFNILEVLGMDVNDYNLNEYAALDALESKDVYINAAGIRFANTSDVSDNAEHKLYIGHCVRVLDNAELVLPGVSPLASYNVVNDIRVYKNAKMLNNGTLNIGRNLNVWGEFNQGMNYGSFEKKLTVGRNLNVNESGKFTSVAAAAGNKYVVKRTANIDGELDSNTNYNTIGSDFNLAGTATFNYNTETTISGIFNSYAGSELIRKQLGTDKSSRATVDAGKLGYTNGIKTGSWPQAYSNATAAELTTSDTNRAADLVEGELFP